MALKPDIKILDEDISYYVLTLTGPSTTRMERGGCLAAGAAASGTGAGMDTAAQYAYYPTDPSGTVPLGVLAQDFVNIDQSRQYLNPYKDEAQIGSKCTIYRKGWVVTDRIAVNGQPTGTVPFPAYNGPSGTFTTATATGRTQVGQFMTRIDSNGYAKLYIDL